MFVLRKSSDRGEADHGWLKAKHSFSFADYYDPRFMGFSDLRVINEDRVTPGMGFGTHPHREMEIITYIISGALEHKDSMGNKAIIRPGEVQRMSAGTGVTHSEYNPLHDQETHLLQIWIMPDKKGIQPSYEKKSFDGLIIANQLNLVASQDGRLGSVSLNQDLNLYSLKLSASEKLSMKIDINRSLWIQVVKGLIKVNEFQLSSGDGLAIVQESLIHFVSESDSEVLIFDLRVV